MKDIDKINNRFFNTPIHKLNNISKEDLWIEKGFVGEGYNVPDNKT